MDSLDHAPLAPRILHLASWYPSAVHGTLGNFVQRHIDAIATQCPGEVWFAAAAAKGQKIPLDTVQSKGLITERLVYFTAKKPVVRQTTNALLQLAEAHEGPPFDLVHLHVAYPAGRAARQLAKRWKVPLVVTEHWTAYHADQRHKLPFWRKRSMQLTGRASTLLCPVSEDLASSMRDFGMGSQAMVIPNVVNIDLFKPTETRSGADRPFELLHISSLSDEQKNISGMLRAIAAALPTCPKLRVSIIGDGDPRPHQSYARSLGLDQRVSIQGEISLTEVAERMRTANALLLFSNFENFPCVIPEAWASGIPVISTDVGGIAEHVTPERGVLIERGNEVALTTAIVNMVNAPSSAHLDATALRKTAESMFSMNAIAAQYQRAYQKAFQLHTKRP